MGILLIKIIASLFALIEFWCRIMLSLIFWDFEYLDNTTMEKIWKRNL